MRPAPALSASTARCVLSVDLPTPPFELQSTITLMASAPVSARTVGRPSAYTVARPFGRPYDGMARLVFRRKVIRPTGRLALRPSSETALCLAGLLDIKSANKSAVGLLSRQIADARVPICQRPQNMHTWQIRRLTGSVSAANLRPEAWRTSQSVSLADRHKDGRPSACPRSKLACNCVAGGAAVGSLLTLSRWPSIPHLQIEGQRLPR